jgi:hypothetical protein
MSSFACVTIIDWDDSKQLEKALVFFTNEYINSLKEQKNQIEINLKSEISRLEKEIQKAKDSLEN